MPATNIGVELFAATREFPVDLPIFPREDEAPAACFDD